MIYRLDDLCESHDFEHDQKFVKAEHWKEACDEVNDLIKTKNNYEQELTKLRACLKDAANVIEFYAEKGHWGIAKPSESVSIDPCDHYDPFFNESYSSNELIGGRRAREFQTKHAEIIKELGSEK
jgi:hypothetical protein